MERNTSWICTQIDASSTQCTVTAFSTSTLGASTTPIYTQDAGNLSFASAIVIGLLSMLVLIPLFATTLLGKRRR